MSNDQTPDYLLYVVDDKLPSFIGSIIGKWQFFFSWLGDHSKLFIVLYRFPRFFWLDPSNKITNSIIWFLQFWQCLFFISMILGEIDVKQRHGKKTKVTWATWALCFWKKALKFRWWWLQIFFYVCPVLGGNDQIWQAYFYKMSWTPPTPDAPCMVYLPTCTINFSAKCR